jgi:uncharacterized membrane protein
LMRHIDAHQIDFRPNLFEKRARYTRKILRFWTNPERRF